MLEEEKWDGVDCGALWPSVRGSPGYLGRLGTVLAPDAGTTLICWRFAGNSQGQIAGKKGVKVSSHRKLGFHVCRSLEFHAAIRFQEVHFYRLEGVDSKRIGEKKEKRKRV